MAPPIRKTSVILLALLPTLVNASESTCTASGPTLVQGEFAPQGLDTRTFSTTVRAGDDFYNYANEGWIQSTEIPAGHWDYGQTTALIAKVEEQIRSVIATSVAKAAPRASPSQQVGDAYSSFLDLDRIERAGSKAFERDLERILTSRTPDEVVRWMAHPTSSSIVAINVFPAEGRPVVHLDQQNLGQPMLGLPGREAYERTAGSYPATRAAYQAHIANVFELAGVDRAAARAERVVALEAKIASNQWTFELLRDRRANYHPMSVQELTRYAPGFPWRAFLEARGVGTVSNIVLGTDTAMKAQAELFAQTPLDDWRSYLAFHWIQNQIDVLPGAFRDSSWAFYGQVLASAKTPPAREDVALRLASSALGH